MPRFTSKQPPQELSHHGPRVEALARLPRAAAAARGTQASCKGAALIDTGARGSAISSRVVKELNLQPVGRVNIGGVGGAKPHYIYVIDFHLPGGDIGVRDLQVVEAALDQQGLDFLLGRDILSASSFTYDGQTGTWNLEIPRGKAPIIPKSPPAHQKSKGSGPPTREKVKDRRRKEKEKKKKGRKKK